MENASSTFCNDFEMNILRVPERYYNIVNATHIIRCHDVDYVQENELVKVKKHVERNLRFLAIPFVAFAGWTIC